jgi:hypothetical protein
MALVNIVGKKGVHKGACVRIRVKRRMKEALRLVVLRGASRSEGGEIVLNESDIGENMWLLKGMLFLPRFTHYITEEPEQTGSTYSLPHSKCTSIPFLKSFMMFGLPSSISKNPVIA